MTLAVKNILDGLLCVDADWRLQLFSAWPAIVGTLQTRIRLDKIQDDTVIIGVYESHWMQELFLLSRVLISSINKHLKAPHVKHIRFKLIEEQKFVSKKQHHQAVTQKTAPRDLLKKELDALSSIDDMQLRDALREYYIRCIESDHV